MFFELFWFVLLLYGVWTKDLALEKRKRKKKKEKRKRRKNRKKIKRNKETKKKKRKMFLFVFCCSASGRKIWRLLTLDSDSAHKNPPEYLKLPKKTGHWMNTGHFLQKTLQKMRYENQEIMYRDLWSPGTWQSKVRVTQ